MGKLALLFALFIKLTITPQVAISPTDLSVRVHILNSEDNRKLIISIFDVNGEVTGSEIPLSPDGPSIFTRTYKHLTEGTYTVTATLVTTHKTYSDTQRLEVVLE